MEKETKKTPGQTSAPLHNNLAASVKGNAGPDQKEKMKFKIGDSVLYNASKTKFKIVATKEEPGKYDLDGGFDYLLLQTDKDRHKPVFEDDISLASDPASL